MTHYGFIKTAAVTPKLKIADVEFNASEIIKLTKEAARLGAQLIVLPELAVTGYTVADLFFSRTLLNKNRTAINKIRATLKNLEAVVVLGAPFEAENKLFNAAYVLYKGNVLGVVPKTFLPNYKEFYEKRWFNPARDLKLKITRLFGADTPVGTDRFH